MRVDNLEFTYPVLSDANNDYVDSYFYVEYELEEKGFQNKDLVVTIILKDEIIENMIEYNEAKIVLHVECPNTSYRKLYSVNKHNRVIKINIDKNRMREKVEVNVFIILNKDKYEYYNPKFNEEIFGKDYVVYNLDRGAILATTYTQSIKIESDNEDFEKISSIINVGQSKDNFMEVNLDNDVLLVTLPKDEYKNYVMLSDMVYQNIVMTSVIYPALVYVLDAMGDESRRGAFLDKDWYRVIEQKLLLKEIYVEDINEKHSSLKLAQMILESPLERALESLVEELGRE